MHLMLVIRVQVFLFAVKSENIDLFWISKFTFVVILDFTFQKIYFCSLLSWLDIRVFDNQFNLLRQLNYDNIMNGIWGASEPLLHRDHVLAHWADPSPSFHYHFNGVGLKAKPYSQGLTIQRASKSTVSWFNRQDWKVVN